MSALYGMWCFTMGLAVAVFLPRLGGTPADALTGSWVASVIISLLYISYTFGRRSK